MDEEQYANLVYKCNRAMQLKEKIHKRRNDLYRFKQQWMDTTEKFTFTRGKGEDMSEFFLPADLTIVCRKRATDMELEIEGLVKDLKNMFKD